MSDLLPTIIPPEDINNEPVSETTDAFEGDEEIINEFNKMNGSIQQLGFNI